MKYETGIYIGKFFPFQRGHYQTLNKISKLCKKVFLVFFYNEELENKLMFELNYNIDERIEDVQYFIKGKNIEVIKYTPNKNLEFPCDYLIIKKDLFNQIGVKKIDLQIFGADEEEKYKNYIYANEYITGPNIFKNGVAVHATQLRKEYNKYKYLLEPNIRKRLDTKLCKQKYICIVGKSGSGKSSIAKYLEENLDNSICIDIDKIVHNSHSDEIVKNKIIKLINYDILDDENNIDRKKLANIVFNDEKLKEKVYNITWEYVDKYIKNESKKRNYIILDWYNINNKNYWSIATLKILTIRDYESRKQAVMKRDNITSEYFELREKNSNNYEKLEYDFKINFLDKEKLKEIKNLLNQ